MKPTTKEPVTKVLAVLNISGRAYVLIIPVVPVPILKIVVMN